MKSVDQPISKKARLVLHALGKMIKLARIERNLSQEALANRLGVSRLTVSQIEKGNSKVSIGTVFEAATTLNIPLMEEDGGQSDPFANKLSNRFTLIAKRGGRKKKELNDDF